MSYKTSEAAVEMASLATLAPMVIATRLTDFWLNVASPTSQSQREANLMVTEKIQAVAESALAMNMAMAKIGVASFLGVLQNGKGTNLLGDFDSIAAAGLRPYVNKVRANNKRLSRR